MNIGVLALQGNFKEHMQMLKQCGVNAKEVTKKQVLESIDGLIIPGGESTSMLKLMEKDSMFEAVLEYGKQKPVFGTCAGAIILAKEVLDYNQKSLGLIDISVGRNSYGRQASSFETDIQIPLLGEKEFRAIFIRAPQIETTGKNVVSLAFYEEKTVLAKQKNILVSTFHPELTMDKRVHEYFISLCKEYKL